MHAALALPDFFASKISLTLAALLIHRCLPGYNAVSKNPFWRLVFRPVQISGKGFFVRCVTVATDPFRSRYYHSIIHSCHEEIGLIRKKWKYLAKAFCQVQQIENNLTWIQTCFLVLVISIFNAFFQLFWDFVINSLPIFCKYFDIIVSSYALSKEMSSMSRSLHFFTASSYDDAWSCDYNIKTMLLFSEKFANPFHWKYISNATNVNHIVGWS